jgi:hypothetical protein
VAARRGGHPGQRDGRVEQDALDGRVRLGHDLR